MVKHRIDLLQLESAPVHSEPYRAGLKTPEIEKTVFEKMLAENVIERAQMEWAAPIVFALKKNGTLRFCVDYYKHKAVAMGDSYPI